MTMFLDDSMDKFFRDFEQISTYTGRCVVQAGKETGRFVAQTAKFAVKESLPNAGLGALAGYLLGQDVRVAAVFGAIAPVIQKVMKAVGVDMAASMVALPPAAITTLPTAILPGVGFEGSFALAVAVALAAGHIFGVGAGVLATRAIVTALPLAAKLSAQEAFKLEGLRQLGNGVAHYVGYKYRQMTRV